MTVGIWKLRGGRLEGKGEKRGGGGGGGGGELGGNREGRRERGERWAWARELGHGFSNFLKPGPARPVNRSTGLKVAPDSGLRPNFFGPGGPAQPIGDPYLFLSFNYQSSDVLLYHMDRRNRGIF